MGILKEFRDNIKSDFEYYKQLTREIVGDYKESKVKERIVKHEEERASAIKAKKARYAYYTELITQCNCNINHIRASINSHHANLTGLGARGHKELKEKLTREIQWLKNKLVEEEFLSKHYTKLRNE